MAGFATVFVPLAVVLATFAAVFMAFTTILVTLVPVVATATVVVGKGRGNAAQRQQRGHGSDHNSIDAHDWPRLVD